MANDIIIPGWFMFLIGVFLSVFVPWAIWATIQIFNGQKEIALNKNNEQNVNDELQNIYNIIDKSNNNTKERFDKIDGKLDAFLNQEMFFLKQLANKQ